MKIKTLSAAIYFLSIACLPSCAQVKSSHIINESKSLPWKNKQAAIVLTYDDGLNQHLTNAIPILNKNDLKATFYIADFGNLREQIPAWRAAAIKGHELANHTIYHPCIGNRPGREWVKPDNDLNNYTVRRITDEIKTMNTILKAIDGKTKRTFAYPCSDTKIGDTAYITGVKNEFVAVRAVRNEMPTIDKVDLYNLPCYMVNGETGDKLIALVKQAVEKKAMLIFLFHGVGGGNSLNVSLEAHAQLLQYLKQNQKELWIAPMLDVAEYVKDYRVKRN
jgi:peptidoglycan/xylan/chitin deacetylase (PgdA/CDA1 family)